MTLRFWKRLSVAAAASAVAGALVSPVHAQSYTAQPDNTAIMLTLYLGMLAVVILFYLIPTFVAFARKHPNRWVIAVINVAFGGTVIGWFGALVWAMSVAHLSATGSNGGESGLNIFANDPVTVRLARDGQPPVGGARAEVVEPTFEPRATSKPAGPPLKPDTDTIGQLERLAALRASGSLSDEEFQSMKSALLATPAKN